MIGYLSAVDRVGATSTGDPDAWREWWQNPESEHYYFQGKDNIVFHTVIWPAMLLGYGRAATAPDDLAAPAQRRRDRVPDLRRQAVLDEPRPRDLRRRLPRPLRRRRAALLPRRRGPRDAGHRLHLGRVRPPQQRRAARQLGQPRQPDARERAPELRRRARAGRAHRGRPALLAAIERGFDDGRRADRARPLPGGARRGDAALAREPVRHRPAPWALVKTDRERAATVLYVALRAVDSSR